MSEERLILEAIKTSDIKAKNPGIMDLPDGGFKDWSVEKLVSHLKSVAEKKGKDSVAKAVNNLRRWMKNTEPEIATKADKVMSALSKAWGTDK